MGRLRYKPFNSTRPVSCPDCGFRFRAAHDATSRRCPDCRASIDISPINDGKPPKAAIEAKFRDKPLIVEDKHGIRVDGRAKCDDCRRIERYLWHFPKSNHSDVHLCEGCRERARNRSFPDRRNVDVMKTHPIIQTFNTKR